MTFELTSEQRAIVERIRTTKDNLILDALAGTAKTTTLLEAMKIIPQRSVLLLAFNKRIADELVSRMPKMPRTHAVHVKTFHAQGLAILKRHYPKLEVSADATEAIINRAAGAAISFKMRRASVRLLRTTKETAAIRDGAVAPPDSDELLALGYEHNIFGPKMSDREIGLAVEVVRDAYTLSLDLANLECIDFCDMVWAPVALRLDPPSRYQCVIVDELQDISEPQFEMLRMLMIPTGRFIASGDRKQQIYDWRGSMGERAWSIAREELNAQELPLTMTFRCATSIVEAAHELVPELRAMPDALPGSVSRCSRGDLPRMIAQGPSEGIHTFVLSRRNDDLLDCALFLWRERVGFQLIAGKDMLAPLFDLLDYKLDLRSRAQFVQTLDAWRALEIAKAEKANATAWAERIEEQSSMLTRALAYAEPTRIKDLLAKILAPNQSGVLLSTVHKVKGLEAERVFLLEQSFARHRPNIFDTVIEAAELDHLAIFVSQAYPQEELNIEYVAITRAKEHLIWVDLAEKETQPLEFEAQLKSLSLKQLGEIEAKLDREMLRMSDDVDVSEALLVKLAEIRVEIGMRRSRDER